MGCGTSSEIASVKEEERKLDADTFKAPSTAGTLPEVEAIWDQVTGPWAMGQKPPAAFGTQVKAMASMFGQSADRTGECKVEEVVIEGVGTGLIYTPNQLAGTTDKPCLVFCHGGGFTASGPDDGKKKCSSLAVNTNAVVLCSFIGSGPEQQGKAGISNGVKCLKWAHAQSASRGIDKTRIGIAGESHGAWTALAVCKALAEQGKSTLTKVCILDVPAINTDFCDNAATTET